MKRFVLRVLSVFFALLLGFGAVSGGFLECEAALNDLQETVVRELREKAGEYSEETLVLEDTTPARAAELAKRLNATLRITADGTFAALTLPEGKCVSEVLSARQNRGLLTEISLDVVCEIEDVALDGNATPPEPQWPNYDGNDPYFGEQTYLKYLGLGGIWDITRGKFEDGTKVKVAIVDTGIDVDHPEFFDKDGNSIISRESYNTRTDVSVESDGWEVIDDTRGHGTSVAGVIAAQMNNGKGIVGIAPDVELLVIKADNDAGKFYSSDMAFGIEYAVECGAHVINMSIGGEAPNTGKALQTAYENNVIFVCSAGNESTATPHYPSSDPLAIGVGALARDSWELASYSNYGNNIDMVAPGTVYTTKMGGGYGSGSGTSFASPVVAAAVALYISVYGVTPYEELRARLLGTCSDLGERGEDEKFGNGALHLENFLDVDTVKVTFDYRVPTQAKEAVFLKKGERLTKPAPIPEAQEDLRFEGWYLDARLTQKADFGAHVFFEDTVLYARWLGESSGDFDYYEYARGFVRLLAYRGSANVVEIPATLDDKRVNVIASGAFAGDLALQEISLPENLRTIGTAAFVGCENLKIVRVHSADILQQITSDTSPGELCQYADALLADETAVFDEKEIALRYSHAETVVWQGVSYRKYSNHESEWKESEMLIVRIPCMQDGVVKLTCDGCGCASETQLPKHTAGEWAVHVPAQCTVTGTNAIKCTDCKEILQTRETPATGHSYGEGVTIAPTCEERGYFLRVCKSCGYENKGNYTKANGHDKGEWTRTLAATKTEAGKEQISCLSCEKVLETRSIAPLSHLVQFENDVKALTGECSEISFESIAACVAYYGTLSEEERALAKSDYEQLCEIVARYNERATARNEELSAAGVPTTVTVAQLHRVLGGIWFSLCEKLRKGA